MIKIAQGAEAVIYEDNNTIIKERVSKKYRTPELDVKLIKSRTKKEAKILNHLRDNSVTVPKILKVENNKIFMEKIIGNSLKNCLNESNQVKYMAEIGKIVAKMHNLDVIHGDLTTLNFILSNEDQIFAIDFGLSFYSNKDEDKAVDLYVFEKAIKCGHDEQYLDAFYKSYSENGSPTVLKRLESVRLRGRKREEEALI